MGRTRQWLEWTGLLGVAAAVLLCGTTAHAAGLLVADGGFGGVLEIKEHAARVTINNGIAVTEVDQVFVNTENRQVEALYTFPVPAGASVANFSMWINGEEMVGEVVEKERAREIYNSYKQRRRDPGLLEQVDYKTFEMRIFPIAAGAEQRVQISYYQELDFDHDWATYVYPLATVTRSDINQRTTGKFALTLQARSRVPIVAMESPSHANDFVFTSHGDSFHEASLETGEGSLERDVVLAYHLSRPETGIDLITSRSDGEDGFFYMTITAGEELAGDVAGMDFVFVLDISGSMGKERKLETSSNAARAFIEALGEEDRFEVMTFNVAPSVLFGGLETPDDAALARAAEFLGTQEAKGGTVLQPAMHTAYRYADPDGDRPLNVVILSDGMTEQNERAELLQLIQSRPQNSRVFCIGVGNEVNRALLAQMAEEAGGLAALISHGDNFERQASAFRRKLMHPVATNLEVLSKGAELYDVIPEQLPNLYHGAPVRIYGRYRGGGPVELKVRANLNGYGMDQDVTLEFPDRDPNNPEIERMWAWHKVQSLQKAADRNGSRQQVLAEIVRLGEAFSIVTEYTSFLVLENNAEYKRWKIERRNALRIDRDRAAQAKVRSELERIRMAALKDIGPVQAEKVPEPEPQAQPAQRQRIAQAPRSNSVPLRTQAPQRAQSQPRARRRILPSGAIDPISGSIAASLAVLAAAGWRKKKQKPE